MGELAVPAEAYYGVQTARAIENFPISPLQFPRSFIRAMGLIKRAAATVNHSLGLIKKAEAEVIKQAARKSLKEGLTRSFPWIFFKQAPARRPI